MTFFETRDINSDADKDNAQAAYIQTCIDQEKLEDEVETICDNCGDSSDEMDDGRCWDCNNDDREFYEGMTEQERDV